MSHINENIEFDEMMLNLENQSEENAAMNGLLDVRAMLDEQLTNLRSFKKTRSEMVAKRAALDNAIHIMDKRLEITLDTIKILQLPK